MSRVVVAGTFDTKAEPLGLLVEKLRSLDAPPVTIDTGVSGGFRHGFCGMVAAMVTAEDAGVDGDGRRVEAAKLLHQKSERLGLGVEGTRDHHPAHGPPSTITTLRAGPGRALRWSRS